MKKSNFLRFSIVILASVCATGGAFWYWLGDGKVVPQSPPAAARITPIPVSLRTPPRASAGPSEGPDTEFVPLQPAAAPRAPLAFAEPHSTLTQLEQLFRSNRNQADRGDYATEIAGWNNREAVIVLARLFRQERHPKSQMTLLAALGDIEVSEAPDERLAILEAALRSGAQDVRSTALQLLGEMEDKRAAILIQERMRSDPNKEVRELAAALYRESKE